MLPETVVDKSEILSEKEMERFLTVHARPVVAHVCAAFGEEVNSLRKEGSPVCVGVFACRV